VPIGVDDGPWLCRDGGCSDFAFVARAVIRRELSLEKLPDTLNPRLPAVISDIFCIDVVEERLVVDARLGLRLWDVLKDTSGSVPPSPMDLRGPFVALFTDMGGYWLCLRVRMARGADGGSIVPEAAEAVEDMLLCRVEILCRLKSEPLRTGLVIGAPPRPVITVFVSLASIPGAPLALLSAIMLPDSIGSLADSENGSSICSLDADAMLL